MYVCQTYFWHALLHWCLIFFIFLFWGKYCSSQFFFVGVFLRQVYLWASHHFSIDDITSIARCVAGCQRDPKSSLVYPLPLASCLLSSPLCSLHCTRLPSWGKKAMLCVRAPNNTLLLLTLVGCRVSLREGVGKLPGKITALIRLHLFRNLEVCNFIII